MQVAYHNIHSYNYFFALIHEYKNAFIKGRQINNSNLKPSTVRFTNYLTLKLTTNG